MRKPRETTRSGASVCSHQRAPLLQRVWEGVCPGSQTQACEQVQHGKTSSQLLTWGRSVLSSEGGEKALEVNCSGYSLVLHNRQSSVNVMDIEELSKTTRPFLLFFLMGRSMVCL